MTLMGIIEALGLGSARDAKLLVARLGAGPLTIATGDERVVRALAKAQHRSVSLSAPLGAIALADAAIALGLPDGDDAFAALQQLAHATRDGGEVIVATIPVLGRTVDRARVTGLFLRAGLVELAQDVRSGVIYTTGRVARLEVR